MSDQTVIMRLPSDGQRSCENEEFLRAGGNYGIQHQVHDNCVCYQNRFCGIEVRFLSKKWHKTKTSTNRGQLTAIRIWNVAKKEIALRKH